MRFYASQPVYSSRYGSGLIAFLSGCAWMLFYPLALGKGIIFFEVFNKFFLSSPRLTAIFLGLIIFCQVIGYLETNRNIHFLFIKGNSIIIKLFNGKSIKFNYSQLLSVNITKDLYLGEVFEFTFKSGEIKKIRSKIKNKQQALTLIQQKIQELQT
jgi:hypothetical protein